VGFQVTSAVHLKSHCLLIYDQLIVVESY
jgi:hypothetical protein